MKKWAPVKIEMKNVNQWLKKMMGMDGNIVVKIL